MRTQEIVEAYGKTHIYMIGMDDNPQPKHIDCLLYTSDAADEL